MRVTVQDLADYKRRDEKFAMVTAYDYTSAQLVDRAGLPLILVGDSLGTVVQGHDSTIPVTLQDIVYHSRMVVRGSQRAMVVGDLPFMSYRDAAQGLESAARLFQEGRVQAVKLEGGGKMAEVVAAIVEHGIPVMGHLGYTPQSAYQFGKQIVRGKTREQAHAIRDEARRLADAGAFAVVLECVPAALARMVTSELAVPTIGIGSGPDTDGQVQVWHDLLGLYADFVPRHAKQYARLAETIEGALTDYQDEVRAGLFPTERHASSLPEETLRALLQEVGQPRRA
ncbi:MAG: 3-methyl-2-oxobutanoate hydroxymethyltransferase [Fimbriimonadaceae bacterium]|nr:3-methyl-2-oxobutanoate hydroxymethyltransferase [Fimbriimonadaceae bacterium]